MQGNPRFVVNITAPQAVRRGISGTAL
jgi:hypothetical protein